MAQDNSIHNNEIALKQVESSNNKSNTIKFKKLVPDSNIDIGIYNNALTKSLESSDIYNIGLTGSYGAGKSSIIQAFEKSYLKNHKDSNKFLYVSLSQLSQESSNNSNEDKINLKNRVEEAIVNQIVHQIDPKLIPRSKFKSKSSYNKEICYISILTTLFIFLLCVSFNLFNSNYMEYINNNKLDIYFIILLCLVFYLICYKIFGKIYNFASIRFKLNTINIEADNHIDDKISFFDKHLDDILYILYESKAKVIVFEDIDRFNNHEIFVELKEINRLLNNRHIFSNKKNSKKHDKVVFLYLVHDDLFSNEDRCKFFDIIIPVIPYINNTNSYDVLCNYFKDENIDYNLISLVSFYIKDMRLLNNIYNEFTIYKEYLISDESNQNNNLKINHLFALMVYKNLYPKDFDLLYKKQGILYNILNSRNSIINKYRIDIENKIKSYQKELNTLNQHKVLQQQLIDLSYTKVKYIHSLINNYANNDSLLIDFCKDRIEPYYISRTDQYNRLTALVDKNFHQIKEKECQINNLSSFLHQLNNITLQNLWSEYIKDLTNIHDYINSDINVDDTQLVFIHTLVVAGYIDEFYYLYLTPYRDNSLSPSDEEFLNSYHNNNVFLSFYHTLNNIELVYHRIKNLVCKKSIYNKYLLNYLLKHDKNKYNDIINYLVTHNITDVFMQFVEYDDFIIKIFISIYKNNHNNEYLYNSIDRIQHKGLKLAIINNIYNIIDIDNQESINDIIKYFLNLCEEINILSEYAKDYTLYNSELLKQSKYKFRNLSDFMFEDNIANVLKILQDIFDNDFYEVNENNIKILTKHILKNDTKYPLYEYIVYIINNNIKINDLCKVLECILSNQEEINHLSKNISLILYIINSETILETIKENVIKLCKFELKDISKIKELDKYIDILIEHNRLVLLWNNILFLIGNDLKDYAFSLIKSKNGKFIDRLSTRQADVIIFIDNQDWSDNDIALVNMIKTIEPIDFESMSIKEDMVYKLFQYKVFTTSLVSIDHIYHNYRNIFIRIFLSTNIIQEYYDRYILDETELQEVIDFISSQTPVNKYSNIIKCYYADYNNYNYFRNISLPETIFSILLEKDKDFEIDYSILEELFMNNIKNIIHKKIFIKIIAIFRNNLPENNFYEDLYKALANSSYIMPYYDNLDEKKQKILSYVIDKKWITIEKL